MDQMKLIQVEHEYDRRGISPIEFLLAVMRDPTLPIPIRAKAAKDLMDVGYVHITEHLTIRIEGGLPKLLDTPPCVDINDCITRTTPCPWTEILRSIQGVNFRPCHEQTDHASVPIRKDPRLQ
jgi:hypothetical protein